MDVTGFAQCPGCRVWFSARDIIDGRDVEPIGMTLEDGDADWNLYYFNHLAPHCGTTFVVRVNRFDPFIEAPIPPQVRTADQGCGGRCTSLEDRSLCFMDCRWTPYRQFLRRMLAIPRGAGCTDGVD